jgi:hypothetical protein
MASYPLLCNGGYPVPETEGMVRIQGLTICADDVGLESTLELTDAKATASDPSKPSIFKWTRASGNPASETIVFPDTIKTRNGLRAYTKTNCTVYVHVS